MSHFVVLFNLKAGVAPSDYETWARSTDMPTVRALNSTDSFEVFRTVSVRGSDKPPPYQYVELIAIPDLDRFGAEVANDRMREVARQFREFAQDPMFIVCDRLED